MTISTLYCEIKQSSANAFMQAHVPLGESGGRLIWALLALNREITNASKHAMAICREKNEAASPALSFSGNIVYAWTRSILTASGQAVEYPESEFVYLGGIEFFKPKLWLQMQTWNYAAATFGYFILAIETNRARGPTVGLNVGVNR